MRDNIEDPANIEHALALAQDKLDRFERKVLNQHALVRLRANAPLHPFLIFRFLSLALCAVFVAATLAVMAAPLINRDIAAQVGDLDAMFPDLPLPAAAALLAGGFLLFALCAHLAAIVAGRSAPLLPGEARTHQRLTSDVKRLEAQLAVSARLTPRPTTDRMEAFR